MANGKDAEAFTKKIKRQDHNLNREIDNLSTELHGKLSALEKEAKQLKEQHTKNDGVDDEKTYLYGVDVRLCRRKSEGNGRLNSPRIKEPVRRRKSIADTEKRPLSRIDSEGCLSADSAEIQTSTNTSIQSKHRNTGTKPMSTHNAGTQNGDSEEVASMKRNKRRTSLDPNNFKYEGLGRRRGSPAGLNQNESLEYSESSFSGSTETGDPILNNQRRSVTPRGRRMSLPSALTPMHISLPPTRSGRNSALPFHEGPILNHIQAPATLYLRKLKSELEQRKPKSLAQLKANPKTTYQEELEMEFIEEELHRSAVGFYGPTIRETDLGECRYLRRGSERELTLDEIFEKS